MADPENCDILETDKDVKEMEASHGYESGTEKPDSGLPETFQSPGSMINSHKLQADSNLSEESQSQNQQAGEAMITKVAGQLVIVNRGADYNIFHGPVTMIYQTSPAQIATNETVLPAQPAAMEEPYASANTYAEDLIPETTSSENNAEVQTKSPASNESVSTSSASILRAIALYNFIAVEPEELSLKRGDLILNIDTTDEKLLYGEVNGKSGYIPSKYVKIFQKSTEAHNALRLGPPVPEKKQSYDRSGASGASGKTAITITDFVAIDSDELTLNRGDVITDIDMHDQDESGDDDGWWEGEVGGRRGLFPSNYVKVLSDDEALKYKKQREFIDKQAQQREKLVAAAAGKDAEETTDEDEKNRQGAATDPKRQQGRLDYPRFEDDIVLQRCREEIKSFYLTSLCSIPLFPGDEETRVELKDIYTKVSIEMDLPKPCNSLKIPLKSHEEIFTRRTDEDRFHKRILLIGSAGFGKTTTTAKIAYDWSKGDNLPLSDIDLLFVINMRWVDHTSNLEDAIFSQVLPEDTDMTKEALRDKMKALGDRVIIILDAIDESDRELFDHLRNSGSIVKLLRGEILVSCRLVVTTRPWRVAEIVKNCPAFTRFNLGGFGKEDIKTYITQFFKGDEILGQSLLEYLSQNSLVADVSSVPLLALLVCTYWRERRASAIPNRIGQLYDAIFGIMYKHNQSKARTTRSQLAEPTRSKRLLRFLKLKKSATQKESVVDFTLLLQHLGKMALDGLWPPKNRLVFSEDEVDDLEAIDEACQMGLLSKEEVRTDHSTTLTAAVTASYLTKISFFHKSAQEKCAGEHLASLADTNSRTFKSRLKSLATVQDALSIQLILRFACGRSCKAAYGIIQRLTGVVWKSVSSKVEEYYDEALDMDRSMMLQQFQELCLACNYEADCENKFVDLLEHVFPGGRVCFLGISASTATALGYYMKYSSQSGAIRSLTLRPIPYPGQYIYPRGPLDKLFRRNQPTVNQFAPRKLQEITEEYFKTYDGNVCSEINNFVEDAPALIAAYIQLWQACQNLPTPEETNVGPIIDALQYTELELLKIDDFKLMSNIDNLIEACERENMLHLKELRVSNIGMRAHQTERLAKSFKYMPHLKEIDVSRNIAGESLEFMAKTLPTMKFLRRLYMDDMNASVEQMNVFTDEFPTFGSKLIGWHIDGNAMDNNIASNLESHLPLATQMCEFAIDAANLSRRRHKHLLLAFRHLKSLQKVWIGRSQYPDDLLVAIADVVDSLPELEELKLHVDPTTSALISSSSWKHFKSKLQNVDGLKKLQLDYIALEKGDFMEFVELCREKKYIRVRYDFNLIPEDTPVPPDDMLEFL